MKILITHRYYRPDAAPCAHIMHHIASHWVSEGHSVEVLTGQPSRLLFQKNPVQPASEIIDGVSVTRLSLPTEAGHKVRRIINAFRLGARAIYLAIRQKPDLILATSIPPILGTFFLVIAAKIVKARLVYFIMDMHPELGRLSGDFSNNALYGLLKKIDIFNCRQSDLIVVHSEDMKAALLSREFKSGYKIKIINNFSLPSYSLKKYKPNPAVLPKKCRLNIVYAGNVGRFQSLDTVIRYMASLPPFDRDSIELLIMGNGYLRNSLEKLAVSLGVNVRFIDQQPLEIAKIAIRNADLGLVSLDRSVYKYAYPGKIMVYLEQGTPLLAMVEPESNIVTDMYAKCYGYAFEHDDKAGFVKTVTLLANTFDWRKKYRQNAKKAFSDSFTPEKILGEWSNLLTLDTHDQ